MYKSRNQKHSGKPTDDIFKIKKTLKNLGFYSSLFSVT